MPQRAVLPTAHDDRWKFLHANVDVLPPSGSRPAFTEALAGLVRDPTQRVAPDAWSAAEQAMFTLFANQDPARFDALYATVAPYVEGWVRRLSPCEYAGDLTTPLLIVHSRTDPKTSVHRKHRDEPRRAARPAAASGRVEHVLRTSTWRSTGGPCGRSRTTSCLAC